MSEVEVRSADADGGDRVRLKIRMNRDFYSFDSQQKEEYLDDLCHVAGCTRKQIEKSVFLRGCVEHEFEMPKEVARRFLELVEKAHEDIEAETLNEFREFLRKHLVDSAKEIKVITIQVHDERPNKAAVFVHGWRGDKQSFGEMPRWIEAQTGWKSGIFPYPTGLWSHSPAIAYVSAAFDNWVRRQFPGATLTVIAHSMGGVVVRHCLTEQRLREEPLNVKLLVLCASPENGATLASIAAKVPFLRNAQLQDLHPNSSFLFSLNRCWDKWVQESVPAKCRVHSVFGDRDDIVSINNARGVDVNPVPILGATHIDLVKLSSEDATIVQTIAMWISAV